MDRWNVGILIFDNVEVLDFAGPFEVFSRTRLEPGSASRRTDDSAPFNVFTVAKSKDEISACIDLAGAFNGSGDKLSAPFPQSSADPDPCKAAHESDCLVLDPGSCSFP